MPEEITPRSNLSIQQMYLILLVLLSRAGAWPKDPMLPRYGIDRVQARILTPEVKASGDINTIGRHRR